MERKKVNVADCLQKLTEIVKKLTNQLEQSEKSREKFEASVIQYLNTIENNWKQLQSKYFLLYDIGEFQSPFIVKNIFFITVGMLLLSMFYLFHTHPNMQVLMLPDIISHVSGNV